MFKNHKYHLHNICHSCLKTLVKEQNCLQSPWFAQNNFHLFIFNPPLWLLGLAPLWAFGLPSVAFSPSVSYHTSTLHWSLWSWTAAVKPPKMKQRCLQILTPRIRDSCSCSCCVTKKTLTHYPTANTLSNGQHIIQRLTHYPINDAWVTQPERLKGAKDEVKRPEGPPARSQGPEGP